MGYGVCNCVGGPPPHGICGACGIAGPYYVPPGGVSPSRDSLPHGTTTFIQTGVTEEQVRKIVRQEIERAAKKSARRRSES